jgi:hypothetical protein
MTIYLKLNGNIIVSALEFEQDGFEPFDIGEQEIPAGLYSGWFRFIDGQFIFDEALHSAVTTEEYNA